MKGVRMLMVPVLAAASATIMVLLAGVAGAAAVGTITSGVPWHDNNGDVVNAHGGGMIKVGGTYYFLFSHRTGWATNDNRYYTATSLAGPWTLRGNLAPAGTNTWNSQTTYVLPVQGSTRTTYMFMGDRWNAGNLATSTYIWQPLVVDGTSLSMPAFQASWRIDTGGPAGSAG